MTRLTALVFGPDSKTLYTAGFDKVVHVWTRNPDGRSYRRQDVAYRVPINPGLAGAINALAVSPDGTWLAAGGNSVVRDTPGFRQRGVWLPLAGAWSPEQRQDQGTIYLFNTRDQSVRRLRGHHGPVLALAFVKGATGPLLVSVAREDTGKGQFETGLGLWDTTQGVLRKQRRTLPDPGPGWPGRLAG